MAKSMCLLRRKCGYLLEYLVLVILIFMCNGSTAFGDEKLETVYYYTVQPGDSLWKISKELFGDGGYWNLLYEDNRQIADPARIYPGFELEIPIYLVPENADERFLTRKRKEIHYGWLEQGYVHYNNETPERQEYPEKVEIEALKALKEETTEDWLSGLSVPVALTEEQKEDYRKKDREDILYSYEIEKSMPDDNWYLLESDEGKWLIVENRERDNSQQFYCFSIHPETGEIFRCERIHGAGGRLYLTNEDGILIWILTKEINGEVIGIAGDYRGAFLYIGGNFYYEKQKDGTVKEAYQSYESIGTGQYQTGGTSDYPY